MVHTDGSEVTPPPGMIFVCGGDNHPRIWPIERSFKNNLTVSQFFNRPKRKYTKVRSSSIEHHEIF